MPWMIMIAAVAFEVGGTVSLKLSYGFSKPLYVVITLAAYAVSFALLAQVLKVMPVSTAYAIWSALGIISVALIGIVFFREPAGAFKIACMALVIAGIVGLHLADKGVS